MFRTSLTSSYCSGKISPDSSEVKYKNDRCAKFIMYEEKDKVSVNLTGLDNTTTGEAIKTKIFSLFKK